MISCISCGSDKIENRDRMLCASCNKKDRRAENLKMPEDPKPINKVSEHQSKELTLYNRQRKIWIKGKKCKVFPELPAEDVHHSMGRIGYADDWARLNEITLLRDERFWIPVSRKGHQKITDNSKWANEHGYTFLRITDPIFRK